MISLKVYFNCLSIFCDAWNTAHLRDVHAKTTVWTIYKYSMLVHSEFLANYEAIHGLYRYAAVQSIWCNTKQSNGSGAYKNTYTHNNPPA